MEHLSVEGSNVHSRGTPLRASTGDTVWAGTPSSAPIQSGLVARVGGV